MPKLKIMTKDDTNFMRAIVIINKKICSILKIK